MRVQQPFPIANLLHRQFDRTHAWCNTIRSHHGTSATPTSILIESVQGPPVISIQSKWDCSRSVDTVRVGLPNDFSVYRHNGYMYRWDVNSPFPKLHWTYFLPRWRYLCITPMHVQQPIAVVKLLHCQFDRISSSTMIIPHETHHGTSAAPSSILIDSVLISSIISA